MERALARLDAELALLEDSARRVKAHLERGMAPAPALPTCCGRPMLQCVTHYAWTCLGCGRLLPERERHATIAVVAR